MGLSHEQCYGTDEQKNSLTHLKWDDMPGNAARSRSGAMTARQVLQYVGTNIFRKMYGDVWVNSCLRQIEQEAPDLAIITDVRFPNEVEAVQKTGGKVMRFTRSPFKDDNHASESSLDKNVYDWGKFDFVIDNAKMSISQQNEAIYKTLFPIGWLPIEVLEVVSQ